MKALHAGLIALAISGTVLAATGGFAAVLRQRAAAVSHQQPSYVPPAAVAVRPPAQNIAEGRKLFLRSCAHCHGNDARGDDGPDLHALNVSDRRIASVVTHGIKGEMPAFGKKHSPDDVAALIAYLRSLD